ncbi:adhesin biosynthesis transcription regulatory family protein [Vibrio parahaemolyticus]|uniref:adhesin biosynthesis transcription regulatory family protein n=1 Tax=Vibrio parahaemolyticus TaxID=670 RepID=UPI001EEC73E0|nr:adhesin biosynthesis transcription regulatory family protein [Vibrio parahaemolyticus]MCG6443635.1 adhesin biosynthesis transcription regulatory family protein [Vibrio parahaemolyticus]MCG6455975.1 adhesin biosynthesis transcription regulatory family protein [Vibrio parahaemolyticus]
MIPGMETEQRVNLLISLTSIRSEPQKQALKQHFVEGLNFSACAALFEITESNFQRAIDRVQQVDSVVESIKELDWARFKSEK